MKNFTSIMLVISAAVLFCARDKANEHYPSNPAPLRPGAYSRLPLGAVKPEGWLRDQLQAQAKGLTGHLDEFWPDLINSAWKGGDGEAWERGPYYLDGLVPLAYLLDDEKLLKKVDTWIEPIIASAGADGWFGPGKNQDRWPLAVASKVLMQYYEASGDKRALNVLKGYFSYLQDNPPDWPDDTWRGVRAMEHAVSGYWLYRVTGDPNILKTIESIFFNSYDWTAYYEEFPWDSAAAAEGKIPHNWKAEGLTAHVVNNAMAVKYPGLWYQQSKDGRYREAVYAALEKYDRHHGQLAGRFSGDEHLSGRSPARGTELCAVVELMFSLETLLEVLGDPALADRLELLAYNALPGTMTPDVWAHQYDQQTNQVLVSKAERDWSTNGDASNIYGLMPNYPCCLANMHQGWPKLTRHLWMASPDNGLAALVYAPSTVTALVGSEGREVTLVEETDYPFEGTVRISVQTEKPVTFPLHIRVPGWAENAAVTFGSEWLTPKSGTVVRLERTWRDGDEIMLTMPLHIETERRYNNAAAVRRGPLYFALRIGKEYKHITLRERDQFGSIDYKGSVDWEIRPATPWNAALCLDENSTDCGISMQRYPISRYPFADSGEMIYDEDLSRYRKWPHSAPVVLTVRGRILPQWGLRNNSAADPPVSPVTAKTEERKWQLVPYGAARLRIAEFPVLKQEQ